jgi:hypothetical protein
MRDGRDPVAHTLRIRMHDEIETEPLHFAIAERDHLAKLPGCVHVQKREWRLGGIERLQRQMQHDRRILADRIEHHRMAERSRHLPHDVDALGFELPQIGGEVLFHGDLGPDIAQGA